MCWWYEFSFDIWGRFGKHYHSILKVDVEIVVLIVEFKILIWEHFLRRFQIFSHLLASWFHPFFFLRKSYRWYMCFINDETAVILAVVPKPIWPKAECILYIRKKQGFFFFSSYCFLMSLHQTCPYSFLRTFFSMFSWYHFRNTLPEPLSPQRFVAGILTENYLLVFLVLCRYTNPVDHHLPAFCPPSVGDSWLVIVRHYYGYYFHFKKSWRRILQGHRRKGIFRQMHTSCW